MMAMKKHPLKIWCDERGVMQRWLATGCRVADSTISRIFTGEQAPSTFLAKNLSRMTIPKKGKVPDVTAETILRWKP